VKWKLPSFVVNIYSREILKLSDGGQVALDWLEDGCTTDSPIVIILPGLTGESQAEYVKCLVNSASRIKLKVVVFNNRGLGGISLKVIIIKAVLSKGSPMF
jgi:abhydrolase domain-containing protein 1/3